MTRRFLMMNLGIMLSVLLVHSAIAVNDAIRKITDQSDPFVQELQKRYDLFLESSKKGDVETYKTTRTKEIIDFMEDHLKKNDMLQDFGREIQNLSHYDHPNYKDFQFLGCDIKGDTARLAYQGDSPIKDASGQPRVNFLIIMFHRSVKIYYRMKYMSSHYWVTRMFLARTSSAPASWLRPILRSNAA